MQGNKAGRIKHLCAIVDAERKRIFANAKHPTDNRECKLATCGECGFTWDDAAITSYTPTPSGRCPFEYVHAEVRELRTLRAINPQWLHRADCALEEASDATR